MGGVGYIWYSRHIREFRIIGNFREFGIIRNFRCQR
jgi:hypothetical protein